MTPWESFGVTLSSAVSRLVSGEASGQADWSSTEILTPLGEAHVTRPCRRPGRWSCF